MRNFWRKKPVVIEAIQFTGHNAAECFDFCPAAKFPERHEQSLIIPTMEGDMICSKGDYIIKGVKGEFYPCKPDIFAMTYDPAPDIVREIDRVHGCINKPSLHENEIVADKQLRVDLDVQLQALKSLPPSRERSLAITKLQEGIMWLGMDLKRLNEPNPYPNSYNPSNTKIEPTADGLKL